MANRWIEAQHHELGEIVHLLASTHVGPVCVFDENAPFVVLERKGHMYTVHGALGTGDVHYTDIKHRKA